VTTEFRAVTAADEAAVREFVGAIGAADRMFLDDQLLDPNRVAAWVGEPHATGVVARSLDRVTGLGSLRQGTGWSAHVAVVRVVVSAADRGRGVGAELVSRLLQLAADRGVTKVVVEVMASNIRAIRLFVQLGFTPEATLRDHVRDSRGNHQDLVVLTQWIDERGGPIDAAAEVGG
jgi:ribosomal protein S18 acetylase RimI-like enzyme